MKHRIKYRIGKKRISREINYIPLRYIFAMTLTVLEILVIIGIVGVLCYYVPLFYLAAWITEIGCVIYIAHRRYTFGIYAGEIMDDALQSYIRATNSLYNIRSYRYG